MGTAKSGTGVTAVYQVSAAELWKTVDFHQPSETIMPPIASSQRTGEGLGAIKVNTLQGGGDVHLLLTYYAPDDHAFNYTIQSSPLPVKNYVGEVRVRPLGENRSELSWRGVYDPDGVSQAEADEILGDSTRPSPRRSAKSTRGRRRSRGRDALFVLGICSPATGPVMTTARLVQSG